MSAPRAVSVVGYKKAGKTRVVEALVRELTERGRRVGTIKHASPNHPIDSPGRDTWRHREAGATSTAILTSAGSAIFVNHQLSLAESLSRLDAVDLIVIEGFKSLDIAARIIVPKTGDEVKHLSNGLEIAISGPSVSDLDLGDVSVPVIPLSSPGELADIVESRAFPLLPGLDCGGCGYRSCGELARAILAREAEAERCVAYSGGPVRLKVDGVVVPMKGFVQDIIGNAVLGMVRALKGVDRPRRVELQMDVGEE